MKKPLYVERVLKPNCAKAFIKHFKAQGIDEILVGEKMHVTVLFSKEPTDWSAVEPDKINITVANNLSIRKMEVFGPEKNCLVMTFESPHLADRNELYIKAGGSSDFDTYKPHVTVSYNFVGDVTKVQPFEGPLEFGPEIQKDLDIDWDKKIKTED